jgi:hypothetical protein
MYIPVDAHFARVHKLAFNVRPGIELAALTWIAVLIETVLFPDVLTG